MPNWIGLSSLYLQTCSIYLTNFGFSVIVISFLGGDVHTVSLIPSSYLQGSPTNYVLMVETGDEDQPIVALHIALLSDLANGDLGLRC